MATKPKPAKSSQKFSHFAIEALNCHNEFRRIHGVPELILNQELCKYAQEWADISEQCSVLKHRDECPYGENIFYANFPDASHTPSAREAVQAWYDTMKRYNFREDKVQRDTLHFTQVIWKNTKELGVGIARNRKGQTYVVANYDPKGNIVGKFVENVPKPVTS